MHLWVISWEGTASWLAKLSTTWIMTKSLSSKVPFNPFTPPACKISRLKSAHRHACWQYIYIYFSFFLYGSITNLLSVLHMLITFLSHAHVMKWKSQNDFKFGTSIGHFSSDRAASMAVKGLWVRFGCSKICLLFYVTVSKKTDTVMCMYIHVHTCTRTHACTLTGTHTNTTTTTTLLSLSCHEE